jgi:hypothetical protein
VNNGAEMNLKETVEVRMQWLITEYIELRKEIDRRSREQFYCLTGSILAMSGVLGLIVKSPSSYAPLLMIIPWILSVFGVIWSDHANHIGKVGRYIRTIEKLINELSSQIPAKTGWHYFKDDIHHVNWLAKLIPFLFFVIPSVAAIFAHIIIRFLGYITVPLPLEVTFMVIAASLITMLIIVWGRDLILKREREKQYKTPK